MTTKSAETPLCEVCAACHPSMHSGHEDVLRHEHAGLHCSTATFSGGNDSLSVPAAERGVQMLQLVHVSVNVYRSPPIASGPTVAYTAKLHKRVGCRNCSISQNVRFADQSSQEHEHAEKKTQRLPACKTRTVQITTGAQDRTCP